MESVEIISVFQKDYELQSWNEQGEITKIEGMLTVAFSFIFSCSHKDRKQLYLIMKIPYMVNMSKIQAPSYKKPYYPKNYPPVGLHPFEKNDVVKEYSKLKTWVAQFYGCLGKEWEFLSGRYGLSPDEMAKELLKEFKRKDEKISPLENQIRQQREELEQRIDKLEKEKNKQINALEKHNALLSELLDERNSGWVTRRDLAIRTNPVPDEPNEFGFPLNFNEEKVHNLHSNEEKSTWCHFKYYSEEGISELKEYDMPWSLYEFLSGRLQSNIKTKKIKKTTKKSRLVKFDSPESLLKYFKETLGDKFYSYSLIDIFVSFIFENIKKPIDLENARSYCEIKRGKKPVPATIHKHLNLLIEHKIIYRKHKGIYEVNEQSINFD